MKEKIDINKSIIRLTRNFFKLKKLKLRKLKIFHFIKKFNAATV